MSSRGLRALTIAKREAGQDVAIQLAIDVLGRIHIEGPKTNVAFLRATLGHPAFREGQVFTGFIDHHRRELVAT